MEMLKAFPFTQMVGVKEESGFFTEILTESIRRFAGRNLGGLSSETL